MRRNFSDIIDGIIRALISLGLAYWAFLLSGVIAGLILLWLS